ncbi:hypothetical protein [Vallitalea sp.]|jgi:hypothetical protein|uniref:hypothetical protein n=1 Tax=Vallitalea sp. TaxID=1882829 RepID=UPI0025FB638F|nr:hypothetical protein [Vallitalea sp.]MCT4687095.1 hypothetical protein [Vallitalea sp.]
MNTLGVILIILVALIVLLFIIYFFNLDMKLVSHIYLGLNKRFDKMEKETKI